MILSKENSKLSESRRNTCINIGHLMIEFAVALDKTTDICPIHGSIHEQRSELLLPTEYGRYGVGLYHGRMFGSRNSKK